MADLEALAKRVEAEPACPSLWHEAFRLLHPHDPYGMRTPDVSSKSARFDARVRIGAYIDAADMLRPKGWYWTIDERQVGNMANCQAELWAFDTTRECVIGKASGPHAEARARLAAALRAIKMEADNG